MNENLECRSGEPGARNECLTEATEAVPVLCREEALVYVENFFRGDRTVADLAALADYLRLLPSDEAATFPFDPRHVLHLVTSELDANVPGTTPDAGVTGA